MGLPTWTSGTSKNVNFSMDPTKHAAQYTGQLYWDAVKNYSNQNTGLLNASQLDFQNFQKALASNNDWQTKLKDDLGFDDAGITGIHEGLGNDWSWSNNPRLARAFSYLTSIGALKDYYKNDGNNTTGWYNFDLKPAASSAASTTTTPPPAQVATTTDPYTQQWQTNFSTTGKRAAMRQFLRQNNITNTTQLANMIKQSKALQDQFNIDTTQNGWDQHIEENLDRNLGIHGHIGAWDRRRLRQALDNTLKTDPSDGGGYVDRGKLGDYQDWTLKVHNFNPPTTSSDTGTEAPKDAGSLNEVDITPKGGSYDAKAADEMQNVNDKDGKNTKKKSNGADVAKKLFGGSMNYYNYYQDGGAIDQAPDDGGQEAQAEDPTQQIMALLQAAQQGDQQAQQTLLQIQQAAQQGDQQAQQMMQMIQQVAQQMQSGAQQAQAARHGAKLNYLRMLRGECPQGTHKQFFKAGGRICKKCVEDAQPAPKRKKVQKECGGGVTRGINMIKAELGSKLRR